MYAGDVTKTVPDVSAARYAVSVRTMCVASMNTIAALACVALPSGVPVSPDTVSAAPAMALVTGAPSVSSSLPAYGLDAAPVPVMGKVGGNPGAGTPGANVSDIPPLPTETIVPHT